MQVKQIKQAFGPIKKGMVRVIIHDGSDRFVFEMKYTSAIGAQISTMCLLGNEKGD